MGGRAVPNPAPASRECFPELTARTPNAYRWADALRQAQLDVLSASAGAVTLAAPTEEAVYAEEGADAVDGVGEGFGGRVRGASTASETGVPETAGDVAQQC